MASDIKGDGDPGSDAGKENLTSGMPRSHALNEQTAVACRTVKPESKGDSGELTNCENGKRNDGEPRPAENENGNDATKASASQQLDQTMSHASA